MKLHTKYDEMGGYDCITPAFLVLDEKATQLFVVDLKDFGGWTDNEQVNEANREKAKKFAEQLVSRFNSCVELVKAAQYAIKVIDDLNFTPSFSMTRTEIDAHILRPLDNAHDVREI